MGQRPVMRRSHKGNRWQPGRKGKLGKDARIMAYPIPIVDCEGCERRFILDPGALIEDVLCDRVRLLCRECRGADDATPGEG